MSGNPAFARISLTSAAAVTALSEQGAGLHTDGEDEGAERLCLPGVGIGKGIDRRPLDVQGVKAEVDAPADSEQDDPIG